MSGVGKIATLGVPSQPRLLPRLRRDIRIDDAGLDADGRPVVVVIDPLRGNYARIGWPESAMLALWPAAGTAPQLAANFAREYQLALTDDDVAGLVKFLFSQQLTEADENGSWQRYDAIATAGRHGWVMSIVHNYLFLRIPLFHPDVALRAWLPALRFIYTRSFFGSCLAIALLGLYLTSREWHAFEAMFWSMAKLQSITLYAAVLLVLKAIHELGHALTAVRLGCRVPTMGIAFMMGAPVFYTDTTDSWRLRNRNSRLAIVIAGVAAEMIVASLALVAWPFLPDGLPRAISFAIITSALVTTLLVNLNPFMRFDGYFALSDILDVPNLQPRAFALAQWRMRELLFGLKREVPEVFPKRLERLLIGYAWLTWIYRVGLFVGIAAMVYAIAVKVLGIALGLFEIVMFLALPVVRELKVWWKMRSEIFGNRRVLYAAGACAIVLAALLVPWMRVVEAPVVLASSREAPLYLPVPGRLLVLHVKDRQVVHKGDLLFEADAPELQVQIRKARLELQSVRVQLARFMSNDKERSSGHVLEQQAGRLQERLDALARQQDDMRLRAPFDGTIVDLDPEVRPQLWLNAKKPLARLVTTQGITARGLIEEADLNRIAAGSAAVFVPDSGAGAALAMTLVSVGAANEVRLSEPSLADLYGGPVAVADEHGELMPRHAQFEVVLAADGLAPTSILRGVVHLEAQATSPFLQAWRHVARVITREQGF